MKEHEEGASHVVTFLVAAAIFIPAMTLMLVFTKDAVNSNPLSTSEMKTIARSSLNILADERGDVDWAAVPVTDWTDDPEAARYVGLRENSGDALDAKKINKISQAGIQKNPGNGLLDYEELREKLRINRSGIHSTFQFHIRSYPIIPTTPDNQWGSYVLGPDVKVAYVGHYTDATLKPALLGTYNEYTSAHGAVAAEVAALDALNVVFTGTPYRMPGGDLENHDEVNGDLVADRREVLDPDGPLGGDPNRPYFDYWADKRLADYQVLIIGSEVDQVIFTQPNAIQSPKTNWQVLLDWVEGGGSLIVLGSALQDDTWLTCNDTACIMAGGGASQASLTEPDLSNPILSTPNALRYTSYARPAAPNDEWKLCGEETYGLAMFLGSNDAGSGEPKCPTQFLHANMAATYAGRFANGGRIVMTSFLPYQIGDTIERQKFFSNVIVYAEIQELYLDVGPTIVENVPVVSSERVVTIRTDTDALIDARLVFYVWGGSARS